MRRGLRGFTLLELIVTLLVLAALALISVPTFKGVIEETSLRTDKLSLASQARHQAATAAFTLQGFTQESLESSLEPDDPTWKWGSEARAFGEMVPAVSNDSSTLELATLSSRGSHCLLATATFSGVEVIDWPLSEGACLPSLGSSDPDPALLAAPEGLAAQVVNQEVTLTWNPVLDAEGYKIFENGSLLATLADPSATSLVTTRPWGSLSTYRLQAFRGSLDSELSSPADALVAPPDITLHATPAELAVHLEWSFAVPSADLSPLEFVLVSSLTPDFEEPSVLYRGTARTFTDVPPLGTLKFYRVSLESPGGTKQSPPVSASPLTPPPTAFTLTGALSSNTANLTWSPSLYSSSYEVYRDGVLLASLDSQTLSFSSPQNPGTSSVYRVEAVNERGRRATDDLTLVTAPPAPVLDATPGLLYVRIVWDEVPGATHYTLERSILSSSMENSHVLYSGTSESFNDLSVTLGLLYHYRVIAHGPGGDSVSNVDTAWKLVGGLL